MTRLSLQRVRELAAQGACDPADVPKPPPKYSNRKVVVNGVACDSAAEAAEYQRLLAREAAGEITRLRPHPTYVLQEGFRDVDGSWIRPIVYEADFEFYETAKPNQVVVVDVKGYPTKDFLLKAKLFRFRYLDHDYRVMYLKKGRTHDTFTAADTPRGHPLRAGRGGRARRSGAR